MIVPYQRIKVEAKAFSMVLSGASDMSALIYQNAMVPAPRLELGRPYGQGISSPRLIPPSGHTPHPNFGDRTGQPASMGRFLIRLP